MAKTTGEMPFLDHLEELRWRIIWSLAAVIVGLIVGFVIVTQFDVIGVLAEPIKPYLGGRKLGYTHPADAFSITLSMALAVGAVIASPVVVYQFWSFLAPALHRHEKRLALPVISGAVVLFLGGVSLAWFFVIPMTLKFLFSIQSQSLEGFIMVSDYFSMITILTLTFGASFELPILILALAALGIVTPKMLGKFRHFALIGSFLLSALITPGDIFLATLALTIPLYLLYEFSIVLSVIVFRRKQKAADAAEFAPRGLM
ncbi:MAG: twin-arginine translocase subunit TatC [Gemmatimonadota bacterium]